jgi:hypothetical protein
VRTGHPNTGRTIDLEIVPSWAPDFIVRPWVRGADYWGVYFQTMENMKKAFDANGITIPFPQRDVHVYQHAATADPLFVKPSNSAFVESAITAEDSKTPLPQRTIQRN